MIRRSCYKLRMLPMLKRMLPLFLAAALCVPAQARVDQITYMRNGVYAGKIGTYSLAGADYLDASQAAKLLGGKIYWYPVSGKLLLQVKGKRVVFYLNSDSVLLNDHTEEFPNPMIVRGGKAFLALKFFVSSQFAATFGFSLAYTESTQTLAAQRDINVTSLNYFTHPDKTRIVLYMEEPLEWQASQKESNLLTVNVFKGVAAREEKIRVGDGVVSGVDLKQENRTVRIIVAPGENFGEVKTFRLENPDRLVIDISKKVVPVSQTITGAPVPGAAPATATIESAGAAAAGAADAAALVIAPSPSAAPSGVSEEVVEEPAPGALPADAPAIPDKISLGSGKKRIVIDAGHGGKDPGGRKLFGLKEKELNLLVAAELYEMMKNEDGFEVMMTRTKDEFIPLADRSIIANNFKADLFISIHGNATRDRREKGFEIYFMSDKATDPWAAEVADYENSVIGLEDGGGQSDPAAMLLHSLARNDYQKEGGLLAGFITKQMEKRTPFKNRGVKQAAFYVLRGTYAPGVLVEMGFMTNSFDKKNMDSKAVRKKIAESIYRGVMDYAEMKGWK